MEFNKLKDGVVALSAFLVTHVLWLTISVHSLRVAFGRQLDELFGWIATNATRVVEQPDTAALIDAYGLKGIVPALATFTLIFTLYIHREILAHIQIHTSGVDLALSAWPA